MDPTLKAKIAHQLLTDMPNYSKALSRTAKYILDHPAEFGIHSIRESAARIGVSTNTLVRLSAALGFDSFDDLRAPFREALLASDIAAEDMGWLHRLNAMSGLASVQAQASASAIGNVSKSLRELDPEILERIVNKLFKARQVYVLGLRASYCLAYYFYYVARMALPNIQLIPRQMSLPLDDLAFAGDTDLLFAITSYPYSYETIKTCAFAGEKGMSLVLLSDSLVSAPDLHPDETLVASTISTHHFSSFIGMLSVMETLLAGVLAHGGTEARARVSVYTDLRDQTDAYWKPKK